jgi:hypothetical protein
MIKVVKTCKVRWVEKTPSCMHCRTGRCRVLGPLIRRVLAFRAPCSRNDRHPDSGSLLILRRSKPIVKDLHAQRHPTIDGLVSARRVGLVRRYGEYIPAVVAHRPKISIAIH